MNMWCFVFVYNIYIVLNQVLVYSFELANVRSNACTSSGVAPARVFLGKIQPIKNN